MVKAPDKNFGRFGIAAVGCVTPGHGYFIQITLEINTRLVDEVVVLAFDLYRLVRMPKEVYGFQIGVENHLAFWEQAHNFRRGCGAEKEK
jgi:hypothetical protein